MQDSVAVMRSVCSCLYVCESVLKRVYLCHKKIYNQTIPPPQVNADLNTSANLLAGGFPNPPPKVDTQKSPPPRLHGKHQQYTPGVMTILPPKNVMEDVPTSKVPYEVCLHRQTDTQTHTHTHTQRLSSSPPSYSQFKQSCVCVCVCLCVCVIHVCTRSTLR